MIHTKSKKELDILRKAGEKHAHILCELSDLCVPGQTTDVIDNRAYELAKASNSHPAFLGYHPAGSSRGFPGSVCVSVNDAIVHGVPNEKPYTFIDGDIVSIDFGLLYEGMITDAAITVAVGRVSEQVRQLINTTSTALRKGIEATRLGGTIGDIGSAIGGYVETTPFSLAKGLAGHGVGHDVHEDPFVPNDNTAGSGDTLIPGTVIAIEPMLVEGTGEIAVDQNDGFTIRTADTTLSAHFEHTVAITKDGVEVLTQLPTD